MNRFIPVFCLLFSFAALKAQVRLGYTESQIRKEFPEKIWERLLDNGEMCINSNFRLGEYWYFFSAATNLCYGVTEIPFSNANLNEQVEYNNRHYVVTSETSWTVYQEDGGIFYIKLVYLDAMKKNVFNHTYLKQ